MSPQPPNPPSPTAAHLLGPRSVPVCGSLVDAHTRCAHYHSVLDIVAIKFRCCHTYYPCYECHEASTKNDHAAAVWAPEELASVKVILCGNCYTELDYAQYTDAQSSWCSACSARFNPGCALHHHLYFGGPGQAREG